MGDRKENPVYAQVSSPDSSVGGTLSPMKRKVSEMTMSNQDEGQDSVSFSPAKREKVEITGKESAVKDEDGDLSMDADGFAKPKMLGRHLSRQSSFGLPPLPRPNSPAQGLSGGPMAGVSGGPVVGGPVRQRSGGLKRPSGLSMLDTSFPKPNELERRPSLPPNTPVTMRALERTALHNAVVEGGADDLDKAIKATPHLLNQQEEHGHTALIVAASTFDIDALDKVKVLLEAGANTEIGDKEGYRAIHWAAAMGNVTIVNELASAGADVNIQCNEGETALSRASRLGQLECVEALLEHKANPFIRDKQFNTCLEVAGDFQGRVHQRNRMAVRKALFAARPGLRTLILTHSDCEKHETTEGHQEGAERIRAIMNRVKNTKAFDPQEINISSDFNIASLEVVMKAHSRDYVRFVRDLNEKCRDSGQSVPFTPQVQQTILLSPPEHLKAPEICDTSFSQGSMQAALRAAGSVLHAIEKVATKEYRNAFCVVRPPGHHAGVSGLLEGASSCGFCIFNSIAIGALHAVSSKTIPNIKRVAIVDIDVHHGNGTEEIVKEKANSDEVMFFSVHLYDKEPGVYQFYPGTGNSDDIEKNVVNIPIEPLWRKRQQSPRAAAANAENFLDKSPGGKGEGGSKSIAEFKRKITERMLPALRAFKPDVILISAGFDGAANDVGNGRLMGKKQQESFVGGLDLDADTYIWLTEQIMRVANITCDGRVVSVLEGGYGHYEMPKAGSAPPKEGALVPINRESLAANVVHHMRALVGKRK